MTLFGNREALKKEKLNNAANSSNREGELIYRRNADKPRFYGTSERLVVFGWCLNICNDTARYHYI